MRTTSDEDAGIAGGVGRLKRSPRQPQLPQLPLLLLMFLLSLLVLLSDHGQQVDARPMPSTDQILENMRQIPQWHCLRYRKFDLINLHKRCRNYRLDRKQ